jgi:Dna[CI] antecedent, DciA
MKPSYLTFKSLLTNPGGYFRGLTAQIEAQLSVLENIKRVLPDEVAAHALHCVGHGKKLVMYTDASVWATPLRFHKDMILAAATCLLKASYTELQIKVMSPINTNLGQPKRTLLIPSPEIIKDVENYGQLTEDVQLKQSLLRLSATLSRLQQSNKN